MLTTRSRIAVTTGTLIALAVPTLSWSARADQPPTTDSTAPAVPTFLEPGELPPHPWSDWYAGEVGAGPSDAPLAYIDHLLPEENLWHRRHWTEYDAGALQVVMDAGDPDTAAELTAGLEEALANAAADWLRENPGSVAGWDEHCGTEAGDSSAVYSVHTAPPMAGTSIHLYGIGRVGEHVTVVQWGQMGSLGDAPVEEFRTTLATALNHLAAD
ncbi:hypothetical protein GCM10027160_36630 [Streptomyces calidiresistens]|uniref:Uncharacterized protein n=1 Tax=Streptomyces calidiresistens TaxID=1485586 RepID=A0A7W3T1A8_9ACTN|nr:hypothetical protein [Streptomyces calidiresistens]MBB0229084.1 hypothetical protein [Streptomyces calidiresistens]